MGAEGPHRPRSRAEGREHQHFALQSCAALCRDRALLPHCVRGFTREKAEPKKTCEPLVWGEPKNFLSIVQLCGSARLLRLPPDEGAVGVGEEGGAVEAAEDEEALADGDHRVARPRRRRAGGRAAPTRRRRRRRRRGRRGRGRARWRGAGVLVEGGERLARVAAAEEEGRSGRPRRAAHVRGDGAFGASIRATAAPAR